MSNKTVYPYGTDGELPEGIAIVNDLVTGGADKALAAQQGVVLQGEVDQLEAKVDDIATGKFYGYHPTVADLPEGDVPGYAYVGTESPYSIYNFDGETWTDSGATVKRGEGQIIYLEDLDGYAADLSPTAMREFLQSAFDYVSGNKTMLVFPKGVTFTIDIPQVSETDPWYTLAYAAVSGGAGLWINGSCVIDFNFCTIKATPNSYRQYAVVYVPVTTNDVVIKNGNIVGERDEHTLSSVGASDEWDYALYIQSQRNVVVDNMKMSNVRGDGLVIEGYIKFNNVGAPNFSAFTQGTIASGVVTADASSNTLISNKLLLSNYKHTDYNDRLLPSIYGYPTTNGYYTLPFPISVNASFYDESENFVSEENVQYGCQVTIPNGAVYVRISFTWVDATPFVGSTTQTLFLMDFSTNENILVRNSEVFDCGRNGITPVTGTPGAHITIDGCYIHDIYGTNNQVCVDVEGTSFLAGYVHIKNCRIENPGYTGVNLTSSWHNIVENCAFVGCGVVGRSLDNHITGCDIETADAGNGVRFNRVSSVDYSWELTFQKSSVKDTIVRNTGNLFVFNGVVDGCSYRNSYFSGASYVEGFPMLVSNCRIADTDKVKEAYITCGYYENCDFYSSKSINTRDVGPEIVIRNSKIATPTFASASLLVSMYDCIIRRITGTSSYLVHTVGGIFIGNTFINDTGSNASAALAVYPSNVIIVRGNKFIAGTGQWYYSVIQIRTNTGYDNFTCIIEGNAISTTAQLNDGGFVNLSNCGDKGIYFVSKNIALSHYVGKDIKLPNSPSNMKVYRGINIDVPASKLTVTTSPVIYEQDASWTPTATP